ncbi:MAG: nucleoside deaminase [Chloroflexi bacterium]|nr:nucleoside deaminase [Chloroflexota bacterium]
MNMDSEMSQVDGLFNQADRGFMKLALHEASTALATGDYPVGAALVVDGELWGVGRNMLNSEQRTVAHAEHRLLDQLSPKLWVHFGKRFDSEICLYTTLEPCLMCLGISVMHKISRIVVACPDPVGGTTSLDPTQMGSLYKRCWPKIDSGLYKEQSCKLIIEFLKAEKIFDWKGKLALFQQLQAGW